MSRSVRVLIADDHSILRAGLRALLTELPDTSVVADTGDGREVVELVKAHRPDIVLMDISLPGLNGLEATVRLTKEYPNTRVLILSMHSSEEYVVRALRSGAAGYLLKDAAPQELEFAIDAIRRGNTYLSPAISRHVIDDYLRRAEDHQLPLDQLTPRQREILQLIAEGKSTKDIAFILSVSVKTVETHRAQLMDRLQIFDIPGLVRLAVRTGLVSTEE